MSQEEEEEGHIQTEEVEEGNENEETNEKERTISFRKNKI